MNKLILFRWFWSVNYVLTFFKILYTIHLISVLLEIENLFFEYIFDWGGFFILFAYFEYLQIPLCLLIFIFFKSQRTFLHFSYIVLLLGLVLATFVVFGLVFGSGG